MERNQRAEYDQSSQPVTAESASETGSTELSVSVFRLSPLIRLTLLLLYLSLTLPLPFLANMTAASIPSSLLWVGIGFGGVLLYAALTERVVLNHDCIQVQYANWVPRFFRRGWSLPWSEIKALKPRSTGQGGLVYYFLSQSGQAYLLPMRVAGFNRMVKRVQTEAQIDMTDVRPLSQPWMYFILLGCTLLLLAIDTWTIWAVFNQAV
ncbi:MAG: hypothetical protein ACAF41_26360 [Leptolyngbya sp. BL-A-14]